jgi:hypothetical protein
MGMSGAVTEPAPDSGGSARDEEMRRYGIVRVPVDYFHFGEFRYTSHREAVAQARRVGASGDRV